MPRKTGDKNCMTKRDAHNFRKMFAVMAVKLARMQSSGSAAQLGCVSEIAEAEAALRRALVAMDRKDNYMDEISGAFTPHGGNSGH